MAADPARRVLTHPSPGLWQEEQEQEKQSAEELRAAQRIALSVDLVLAAKRHLGLLRNIDSLPCLHRGPAVVRAIQRCNECPSLTLEISYEISFKHLISPLCRALQGI